VGCPVPRHAKQVELLQLDLDMVRHDGMAEDDMFAGDVTSWNRRDMLKRGADEPP
jgi:hypothetical protein